MTQPYGCDTFEYCAIPTRLYNTSVGPGTKSTAIDQLCTHTQNNLMQLYKTLTINRELIRATITILKQNIENQIQIKSSTRIYSC